MFFDKVSLVTGGFDPIHSGHIRYFERAKDLSNYLVVGLNGDPWLKRKIVNFVELATGREKITNIYEKLKNEPFQIPKFFSKGIQLSQLCLKYNQEMESNIPKEGPLVFVANHPFGIIDGLILCEIAARIRGDFRILLNNRFMKDEELNKLFLPVDFDGTPEATKKKRQDKKGRSTDS